MEFLEKKYKLIVQLIGLLFFGFLFLLAWYFYKERMLCFDSAFSSFKIIEYKDFQIELGRWCDVFAQVLPLWALKHGCSLITFLHLYSISYIIIYFIIFLVITLGLNNYRAGIALMLTLCLAFRHEFYYTVTELHQGLAWTILLWAIISPEKEYDSKWKKITAVIIASGLVYVISYFHQFTLFAVVFVLVLELVGNKRLRDPYLWAALIIVVAWYSIRIFVFTTSDYEKSKFITANIFIEQFPNIWHLPSTRYFRHFAKDNLWSLLVVIVACLFLAYRRKDRLLFLFLLLYPLCFLVFILISYYKGESPIMHENYYTILGLFAATALLFLVYDKLSKKWILILITPLLIINLQGIYDAHAILTKRIQYIDRLTIYGRTFEKKKFLLSMSNYPWQYAWVRWGLPFETLLYSSLQHPDSAVTFYLADNMNDYDSLISKENVFLGPDWANGWFSSNSMNRNYYRLPSTGYEKINSSQGDSTFKESVFTKDNVHIVPLQEIYHSYADSFVVVPINIINESGKKLSAIRKDPNGIFLSYHVYDKSGKQIIWDGARTSLEVDIVDKYTQGLLINLPHKNGEYIIEIDFVTEGVRWWSINSRFKLIVR